MNKSKTRPRFSFDPDGDWICSWQDKYSSGGNLEQCLDTVRNYFEIDNRNISDVRQQLLRDGYASGNWWSIRYEEDKHEDEWEKEEFLVSDEQENSYLYEDTD